MVTDIATTGRRGRGLVILDIWAKEVPVMWVDRFTACSDALPPGGVLVIIATYPQALSKQMQMGEDCGWQVSPPQRVSAVRQILVMTKGVSSDERLGIVLNHL
mmetsp:Transcript_95967/g.256452  ORF Transcript_95967/g.256452 Transcript_95967/m.256452 type:complete len:103 (+) Transcript_95967:3-311(+)